MIIFAYAFFLISTPLFFFYSILGINLYPARWKKYLPWLILAIGMFAYGVETKGELDLDRYFQTASKVGNLSFGDVFTYTGSQGDYEGLWAILVVFWIAGRLGIVHILPMITACIVYGIAYYITCDVAAKYNSYGVIPRVIAIQTCILPFFSIVSNIRNVSAFSLIILAVYLDLVKKKRNLWVLCLYIIPVFIHSSAFILILLRIGLIIGEKARIFFLAIVCLIPSLINTLYAYMDSINIGGSLGAIIRTAIQKGYWYLNDKNDTSWARQVASSRYQQLNRLVMLLLAVAMICLIYFGLRNTLQDEYRKFTSYTFLLSIMTISCSWFTVPHYWRFSAASIVSAGPMLVTLFNEEKPAGNYIKISRIMMTGFALVGIPLQLWSIQYTIDLPASLENFVLNNFYSIIVQIFKGVFLI